MTEAIIWLVLWALFAFIGAFAIYAIAGISGVALAAGTERFWTAPVVIGVGIIGALAWFAFAAVQSILNIATIIELA